MPDSEARMRLEQVARELDRRGTGDPGAHQRRPYGARPRGEPEHDGGLAELDGQRRPEACG